MPSLGVARKAALAALTGLGAYETAKPNEANAVMLPEVRALMNEAVKAGGKKLYHWAYWPEDLMKKGFVDPMQMEKQKEAHKPMALYATDQLQKIPGHLSFVYKDTDTTKALRQKLSDNLEMYENTAALEPTPNLEKIVRIVMKPDANIRNMPESFMHDYNQELKGIRRRLLSQEGKGPGTREYNLPLDEKTLTQHWQDLVDGLKIQGVDFQPDVAEHLLLNPEKVAGMFWEHQAWTPEQGLQTFGEPISRKFGLPMNRGRSRVDVGLPPRFPMFKAPAPTPSPPAAAKPVTKSGAVDWDKQVSWNPGASGYTNPELGSKLSYEEMSKNRSTVDLLGTDPEGYAYPNLMKAATSYDQQALRKMKRGDVLASLQNTASELKKKLFPGAIATALGVGGLVGTSSNSEAMPLGKLQTAAKAIPNTLRSEDAFYKLIGHQLNLSFKGGERKPYEVVDVLKNHKNDWRYVVVKDETGKRFQLPMTKDYLNVYLGAKGWQSQREMFNNSSYQDKKYMALKSLGIREAKREATSHVNDTDFRAWNTMQMGKAKEIDPNLVNDYTYVKVLGDEKGKALYMPREYATFLAQKGFVKILQH